MLNNQKIVFSGIQPSGNLHIGNYIGAISQWIEMQKKYNCIFCIVDYHAITVKQDPAILSKKIIEIAKIYIASGIDTQKSFIFKQSDISEHAELAWILNCTSARINDLNKMTQFKDKAGQNNVSVGLYDYPVLMAADILLHETDFVPVGDDQVQHVELCRVLAKRFNNQFGQTFKIPELIIKKYGARIMGLDNPNIKMSKSAVSPANYIAMTDKPEMAVKKIMRAVTDSGNEIKFDKINKPAISNLLIIYSLLSNQSIEHLEKQYRNKNYSNFKSDLANVVSEFLKQFQKKYSNITDKEVGNILEKSAKALKPNTNVMLKKVKEKIGVSL